jgi:hypothetical protein
MAFPAARLAGLIPALFSLALSAFTVGGRIYWQDAGFFATAVHDFGLLYPPGFVLYLLLCKAWTLLLFFVPSPLSLHLFSTACAAAAAGALGLAARDLVRTNGPLFRVFAPDPGEQRAAWTGIVTGCLAASGYTFWSSALYAKGYALLYLVLALLLRALLRADRTRAPSDFSAAAVLIGLAWQAHPSATLAGLALILFVAFHARTLGTKGILSRVGWAAAAALGPALLLPLLALRDTPLTFGDPRSLGGWLEYVFGSRITGIPGIFGWEESRAASVGLYFWEEFLGSTVLVAAGLARLVRANPRLMAGMAAWVVPVVGLTVLFKTEGQHDFWFVPAWIVLWLAAAVGLASFGGSRFRLVAGAAGVLLAAWATAANARDVNLRGYALAEAFGRLHLEKLDPRSILLVFSDDATAICRHLQRVEGLRPDVLILHETELEDGTSGRPSPQLLRVLGREPGLRLPDLAALRARASAASGTLPAVAAFLNANASPDRPVYLQRSPDLRGLLRPDYVLVAEGVLRKLVPAGRDAFDEAKWIAPVSLEETAGRFRRERAQFVLPGPDGIRVSPEAYEQRLFSALVRLRRGLADQLLRRGSPSDLERAAGLYESLGRLDPSSARDPRRILSLARARGGLGQEEEADRLIDVALKRELPPELEAEAFCLRGEGLRRRGRAEEAGPWFRRALAVAGLEAGVRTDLERRAAGP